MIGDCPDKDKALKYTNKHKMNKNVVFLGNSNEIDKILCFTDLFLLPSEQESFGLAALEAMACGLPVLMNKTGIGEDLRKHIPDFVVSECKPEIYLDHINKILDNYDYFSTMARSYVEKYHSFSDFCETWISLINRISND